MIPQTVGLKFDVGKIAPVRCIKNSKLEDMDIKENCFLMLIVYEGSAYFQVGDTTFEAVGPCFVCFDERKQPRLIKKRGFKCNAIYFHPTFLNKNMTFELLHSSNYEQLALKHDMFLLKPFIDEKKYVFPLFEEYKETVDRNFFWLDKELCDQCDLYWSSRSRSFFIGMILMLEKAYEISEQNNSVTSISKIKNPHLKNAVIYIESHYSENITLKSITQATFVSHSTLTQLFKNELNITPIEYLWQYRITVAKKYLEFTRLSVKDISVRCGFKTVQHFSRVFKAYTNNTPTVFRDMAVAERKSAF